MLYYVVFEIEMKVELFHYRLVNCSLDVSKARVLGESLKCTSELHIIG